jgi:hypothetical protein
MRATGERRAPRNLRVAGAARPVLLRRAQHPLCTRWHPGWQRVPARGIQSRHWIQQLRHANLRIPVCRG